MFKNLYFLLNVDVFYVLCVMGYGDELVLCDVNFLVDLVVCQMVLGKVLCIDGVGIIEVVCVIFLVLLLDNVVEQLVWCMEIMGEFVIILLVQLEL